MAPLSRVRASNGFREGNRTLVGEREPLGANAMNDATTTYDYHLQVWTTNPDPPPCGGMVVKLAEAGKELTE